MAGNKNLNSAAKAKNDEFYTQKEDIENELRHYKNFFRDKIVLCNCDDPFESQFFKYFAKMFNVLGLKKLIATCYDGSPIVGDEIPLFKEETGKKAFKVEINELVDWNGDGREDLLDIAYIIQHGKNVLTYLEGSGDFRSAECIELLKQADVVVTNPPFSLFREYVKQLFQFDKKFLIIGNKNAITYKEIFPLIMQNKMWAGVRSWAGGMWFIAPAENCFDKIVDGKKIKNAPAIWLTNIDHKRRHEELELIFSYEKTPEKYPHYDNYDAIEVSKTAEIPCDYYGVMGVPITFLDKYNPEQFEIVGCTYVYGDCGKHINGTSWGAKINGKDIYKRLFIRRRTANENRIAQNQS